MKVYDFILTLFSPILICIGKLGFSFTRKKINGEHYYKLLDEMCIGTVLLTKTSGELSNLLTPMSLKHSAIYLGSCLNDNSHYVAEAVGKGVVLTDLVTFMTTKDVVVACKPVFIRRDKEFFETTLQKETLKFIGLPYDYIFKRGGNSFYCFELAATALKCVYNELQLRCREIVKNKRIYDENTFLDGDFFVKIFDSRD